MASFLSISILFTLMEKKKRLKEFLTLSKEQKLTQEIIDNRSK